MPVTLVRGPTAASLWKACADAFFQNAASASGHLLPEDGLLSGGGGTPVAHAERPGPTAEPLSARVWIWLNHRNLRDLLHEAASARGLPGWLDPPITLFGQLAGLFGIRDKPIGVLQRRRLLSRHAARLGRKILGREPGRGDGVIRGHMLDGVLGGLLPEGLTPAELEKALDRLGGDDFARSRNAWVVAVYRAYLSSLEEEGLRDWRSVNALIADRIGTGELPRAIGNARELHLYSVTSPRARRRMLTALARQDEVEVYLYLPQESEPDPFFDDLAARTVMVGDVDDAADARAPRVQPVPDAAREMDWVARRVKEILAAGDAEPHQIAVVARSGRDNTRRAYRALTRAGVPASARVRTPLVEIPALRALLSVLRGSARNWDYRVLRAVLAHPYFDTLVDLRGIDFIAGRRQVFGLAEWRRRLAHLGSLVEKDAREVKGQGLFADRLGKDIAAFDEVCELLEPLGRARPEAEWIDVTMQLLKDGGGIFDLRRRLCDAVEERWGVVRADQRGILLLERLLLEWRGLDHSPEPLAASAWYGLLRKLLEANELVLSTPAQKGVQVLEAHDAALVPFSHTFVVHANDREFPRAAGSAGVFTEAELQRLDELGIPVDHRENALRRERTLWRAVTQQAGDVWVSYRTTDGGGTPLLPSLMVPEHDPGTELPRVRRPSTEAAPITPAEADRQAAFTLHGKLGRPGSAGRAQPVPGGPGDVTSIAPARPERIERAVVAAVAESRRGAGLERYPRFRADTPSSLHPALRPNPWNGQLRDPEVLRWLEERLDDDYRWSSGQLETYARAPFVFLVDRVLGLQDLEEAEEETSPLAFGSVAHEILERFYREHKDDLPGALTGPAAIRLEAITRQVYAEREQAGQWMGIAALRAQSRQALGTAVREYVAWELGHIAKKGERPVDVEKEFGFEEYTFLSGDDVHGRPSRLRLCGRIDRVDRSDGGARLHHVLDYKSGYAPTPSKYDDATVLQGALYLEVLADEGHDMGHARYRKIKSPGNPQNAGQIKFGSPRHRAALALALSIPARVRAGLFEAVVSRQGRWNPWDIGVEIRRNSAQLAKGNRFEDPGEVESVHG